MKRRQFTHSLLAAASAAPAFGFLYSPAAHAALGEIKVNLDDYTKRFLSFYEIANTAVSPPRADASAPVMPPVLPTADQRWEMYKKVYDGNPRNLDEAKWRAEFEAAWPKYASALETIKAGFNALNPSPVDILSKIGGALRMEQSLSLRFIAYVGTFSGEVARGVKPQKVLSADGSSQETTQPYVAFEVESYAKGGDKKMALSLCDLCIQTIGLSRNQDNTLASSIITNGVYINAARYGLGMAPFETLFDAAGVSPNARSHDNLRSLRNKLQGPASSVSESDALYAGALVVDRWLGRGLSFSEIIRTPKDQSVKVTGTVIDQILKK